MSPEAAMARMLAEVDGESSGGDEEAPAVARERGRCGQFVWPCPRRYPAHAEVRAAQTCPIPADFTKEAFGKLFHEILEKHSQRCNVQRLHVFDEPHERYNLTTGRRERRKHLVFKMMFPFAHTRIAADLAMACVYSSFSFNLVHAYLRYCMVPSAGKLGADLDQDPQPCLKPQSP